MKKATKGSAAGDQKATAEALKTLRSIHFFSQLRGALQNLGLAGWEIRLGMGVYLGAISAFQEYPARIRLREHTDGTTAYLVRKVANLLPPGRVVTVNANSDEEWTRFSESPNGRLVFIPRLSVFTENDTTQLDVMGDRIIRTVPEKVDGRVVEHCQEVEGRFACISSDGPEYMDRRPRWLTMVQPKGENNGQVVVTPVDRALWHEVARLLEERAQLPIILPEWEQVLLELMFERDERALRYTPALMQLWRTTSLIRSFQSEGNDKAAELRPTFEDLAVAILLGKKVFREAQWLPSAAQLLARLPKQSETGVMHPLTGKGIRYNRVPQQDAAQYSLPL